MLDYPSVTPTNEWPPMEKPPRPWLLVSLKDTMGTMGRDPQINERDIFRAGDFHSSAAKRAMGMIFRIGILPSRRLLENLIIIQLFYSVFQRE